MNASSTLARLLRLGKKKWDRNPPILETDGSDGSESMTRPGK